MLDLTPQSAKGGPQGVTVWEHRWFRTLPASVLRRSTEDPLSARRNNPSAQRTGIYRRNNSSPTSRTRAPADSGTGAGSLFPERPFRSAYRFIRKDIA